MNLVNLVTDPYDRPARLYPAFVFIAPAVGTVVATLSYKISGLESLGAGIAGFGGAFLLTQLASDAGRTKEKALFERWGGMPSVAIFRHRDSRITKFTKERFHKKLGTLVKEAKPPTVEQEQNDPTTTDAVYSAWSNYLRIHTREKKFSLLFGENVSYGYRRNVWGLRPYGIAVAAASFFASLGRAWYIYHSTEQINEPLVGAGIFAFVMLLLWIFRFTPEWVRIRADAYAQQLAECTELLGKPEPPAKEVKEKKPTG